jgi:succinyl-diaminopimelate desuccinylase
MDLIELVRKLVSIPSYVGKGTDERTLGEFIYNYLCGLGYLQVEKQAVKAGRFNVIAHDSDEPYLMFCCHMDTVPPFGEWEHPPFAGEIIGDRLYGLGAVDMKGGIACLLHALQSFQETKGLFLLFDVGEEYHFEGMLKFLAKYRIRPKLAIFPEPGLKIGNGHRGLIEVKFRVRGKTGHAARPELGRNAIMGLYRAVEHLLEILQEYQHPVLGKSSCNLAWLMGGIDQGKGKIGCQANKIPDIAKAVLDIRPACKELRAQVVLDILQAHLGVDGFSIERPRITHDFGALYIPPERLASFEEIIREVLGTAEYDDISQAGYGEGQLLNERLGIDCVYFGPGPKEMAHQVDEYVSIEELKKASEIYRKLIERYCSVTRVR